MREAIRFVILLVAFDLAVGAGLGQLYQRTTTGEGGGLLNYALSKDPDVLVLGSSRAKHHIDPAVLSKKLSMTTFNAGINGQELLYAVMLVDLWKHRHAPPRAIVLQIDANTFEWSDDELAKTSVFSYYADENDRVREILYSRSDFERLKYLSRSYRFNGKVFPILKNLLAHPDHEFDGYVALDGTIDLTAQEPIVSDGSKSDSERFSERSVAYFRELVEYCRQGHTQLFLINSPRFREYREDHDAWLDSLSRFLVAFPDVQFINIDEFTHPSLFADRMDMFKDTAHLNARGSQEYSKLLATALEDKMSRDGAER
jgi:hypothetical protein